MKIDPSGERLLQARAARSARLPGGKAPSVFWRAKNAGNMVGQLFLRSYERSDVKPACDACERLDGFIGDVSRIDVDPDH